MDHPHVQQRGFVAPAAVPVQQQPSQRSILVQTVSASQCRESLLSRALRRDADGEGDERDGTPKVAAGLGISLEPVAGVVPKPILRRASCVESTVYAGRIEERGYHTGNEEQYQQSQHQQSSVVQPPPIFQQPQPTNQPQPPLARKSSLKFAIAPPPIHATAPLFPHASVVEPLHPGSRRSSLESGPSVAVEAFQADVLAERLIGDIEEDDEEQDEDDEDQDYEDQEDDEDQDEEDPDDDGECNDDSISNPDHEDLGNEEDDEDQYSSTNWSGYEEDSEAGLSDEELVPKETLIVSPGPRRKLSLRGASAEDIEGSTAFA